MKFLLLNILAAALLIGFRILGHVWICRRPNQIKMKKTIILVVAIILALSACTKVVSKPGPIIPQPAPYISAQTHLDTVVLDH